MKLIAIKFSRPMAPYREGEIAGFDERTAERIIDAGFGDRVGSSPDPKSLDEAPSDKMVKSPKIKKSIE